jgi:TfoX/Sxy family transcriptional regulator of competence genes
MPQNKPNNDYTAKLAAYEELLATIPAIERKGKTFPYTSHNGNMFTLLNQSGTMALRLPADAREKFLHQHNTKLFESHGVVMKEYVAVPDALLQDTSAMREHLATSYRYAQTLRPKPTTKRSTTKNSAKKAAAAKSSEAAGAKRKNRKP